MHSCEDWLREEMKRKQMETTNSQAVDGQSRPEKSSVPQSAYLRIESQGMLLELRVPDTKDFRNFAVQAIELAFNTDQAQVEHGCETP